MTTTMNIQIEEAQPGDFPQLIEVWNQSLGANWPLTEQLLRQSFESEFHEPQGVFVARDLEHRVLDVLETSSIVGWIWARSNKLVGEELGRFAGRGGIGALCVLPQFQHRGIATQLCDAAENYLSANNSPLTTLIYPAHLLPGVPLDCASAIHLFEKRGYKRAGEHHDLRRSLIEYSMPPKAVAAMQNNASVEIRRAREDEAQAVQDFVAQEFPGGWTYSTQNYFRHGGVSSDFVVAVENNEIIGFCHTADFRSSRLLPSTYWHRSLGEKFGVLGPIGMAREHRKRGLGLALCAHSVQILKDAGVEAMAIDWTTLVDFYGQMGFTVWKSYVQMEK